MAVLLGTVFGSALAQTLILVAVLASLGLGAARLAAHIGAGIGVGPQLAALTAAVWNPLVRDRLLLGQWTILLGLALLPWTLRACVQLVQKQTGLPRLLSLLLLAGLGGANTLAIVSAPVLMVLVVEGCRGKIRLGEVLASFGVVAGMASVWAVPALAAGVSTAESGVHVFAPVADTPLGVVGSLASGGGVWNTAVHSPSRGVHVVAVISAVLVIVGVGALARRAVRQGQLGLVGGVGVPTLLVVLSVIPAFEPLWSWLVTSIPGGGILRDSQKFMAPWVVAGAVGLALVVSGLRRSLGQVKGPVTALLVLVPVALSPLLAWGAAGQLDPARVPESYRLAVDRVNQLPPGDVAVLPWSQYRRYAWNEDRISLTLMPRLVDRVVVYDDSLPLRSGRVPGESPRAASVTRTVDAGGDILAALGEVGVRYVAVEQSSMGSTSQAGPDLNMGEQNVVIDGPDLVVIDLGGVEHPPQPDTTAATTGWLIFGFVTAVVGIPSVFRRVLSKPL
ncbi:MAG: hypothetical protein Q4G67_03445 [Actinomycetia bacterium]|nr:hypothetical protein [Actinomycetes bacterium]